MKRYLMRGGQSPLDTFSVNKIKKENLVGGNTGNLLYAFGVYRTLMTEDCEIDVDYYAAERNKYNDEQIAEINKKYDAYICPLADAFRDEFASKLLRYAEFFRKLTIPVYVIGMGLRSPLDQGSEYNYTFDKEAREFINAVREKNTILGLRGRITGDYFKYLGYKEGVDYMVIGCPSMYTFGRQLPHRDNIKFENGKLNKDTVISFNASNKTPNVVVRCLFNQMDRFPNHYLVEQNEGEVKLLYYGLKYKPTQKVDRDYFPLDVSHPLIQEDRYRIFINVKTWFDFMKNIDLSIGCKLHGNVAALISGSPAVFIPIDGRMRELIDFHHFATFQYKDINENMSLEEILNSVDLNAVYEHQAENFDNFIKYLDANNLDHIYKNDINRKDAPVDALMDKEYPLVENITKCTIAEAADRFNEYIEEERKTISKLKKESKKVKSYIQGLPFFVRYFIEKNK